MNLPQVEDGYFPIATKLADQFARVQLSGSQWRCLWYLMRKTYGWRKSTDVIVLKQWVSGTGLIKQHVSRALKELVGRNIVTKIGNKYKLQKDFTKWIDRPVAKAAPKGESVTKIGNNNQPSRAAKVTKNGKSVTKNGNKSLSKLVTTKNSYKNTLQKIMLGAGDEPTVLPQLKLSLWYHSEQRKKLPNYSLWLTDDDFVDTVARGAVTVELLLRKDKWLYDDLATFLEWVLNSSKWSVNIRSLAPVRDKKKGKGTPMKIENARDWMLGEKSGGGSGGLGSNRKRINVDRGKYADNR